MFTIQWMGRRRAEDGHIHLWGYGCFDGGTYTFWRLKRTDPIQFKNLQSYSHHPHRSSGGEGIEAMVAEKRHRGYLALRLHPSRRRHLQSAFLVAVAFTGLHRGRKAA